MSAIARVDVYAYTLTYVHGRYVMSSDRVVDALESVVVRVTTDGGVEGFGEVCPLGPTYLPGHAEGAKAALRELAPVVLGLDVGDVARVALAMDSALAGHAYAKSPLEIACLDALARSLGRPLTTLLGGTLSDCFPLYMAVPLGPADEMVEYVRERRAEGIHRFQLKVGDDPHEDAERVRAVVAATRAEDVVIADANGGWALQDAVVAARLLEPLERVFLEQPCATLEECLIVRERTTLPIVLDEVITDLVSLLRAFEAKALEAFNLKISKVGGLMKARLLRDVAHELGIRVTIEDTWGGDLTTAAVAHLAASTAPRTLFTVSFMNDWTNEHVAGYQPRSKDGYGKAPRESGLGVDVDVGLLGDPVFSVVSGVNAR